MTCALCREKKKLCNSHIIPEFLFKPLYDGKHQIHIISTDSDMKPKKGQKGTREKLLCGDCEGLLSKYEKYAREVMYGGREIGFQETEKKALAFYVDYKIFKLFQDKKTGGLH